MCLFFGGREGGEGERNAVVCFLEGGLVVDCEALVGDYVAAVFGGEGFVTELRGQGDVYMQSRSIDGLGSWTNSHLPY